MWQELLHNIHLHSKTLSLFIAKPTDRRSFLEGINEG